FCWGSIGHECPRVGQSVCMSDGTSVCWTVCLYAGHCVCISVMLSVCVKQRVCMSGSVSVCQAGMSMHRAACPCVRQGVCMLGKDMSGSMSVCQAGGMCQAGCPYVGHAVRVSDALQQHGADRARL
uniref:Uncharacterized protein n=1 Tax=Phasianus colchicus TaxID=9054 RepID=A0A669P1B1_PHACC